MCTAQASWDGGGRSEWWWRVKDVIATRPSTPALPLGTLGKCRTAEGAGSPFLEC